MNGLHVLAAIAVHLYTICGGILAFFVLVDAAAGRFDDAMLLLGIAFIVDATDGVTARHLMVSRILPSIDGAILDLVIDISTFAVAPLFLLWCAGLLPQPHFLWAAVILVAAYYDFANTHPLKERGLYTGLPALWNMYAFHVYYLRPSEPVQMICIAAMCVLTFTPVHFIVLSRLPYLRTLSTCAIVAYLAVILSVMLGLVSDRRDWALVALFYPIWYLASSLRADFLYRAGMLPLRPAATFTAWTPE